MLEHLLLCFAIHFCLDCQTHLRNALACRAWWSRGRIPADGHGKFCASCHTAHAHVQQRLHDPWDEALVLVPVSELASTACATEPIDCCTHEALWQLMYALSPLPVPEGMGSISPTWLMAWTSAAPCHIRA